MSGNNTFAVAYKYHVLGRCVIPSGGGCDGKAALIQWKSYQSGRPADTQLQEWQSKLSPKVWAMVTGSVSKCFVIDCDTQQVVAMMEAAELSPHVKTAKGYHYYRQWPSWTIPTKVGILPGIDIRGQGGYVNFCGANGKVNYEVIIMPVNESLITIEQLPTDALEVIERAGRTCYKSEDKITQDSAKTFVEMVIKRGHHSVIEHANMSIRFICDRGVTHEIVRHRLVAYSQESTRYCNYSGGVTFVIPPWVNIEPGEFKSERFFPKLVEHGADIWIGEMSRAEKSYIYLLDNCHWTPQQARSVLPNSLKTEIVCTANLREWRHIFNLRTSSKAHPQMREIMRPLPDEVKTEIPVIFDDITY